MEKRVLRKKLLREREKQPTADKRIKDEKIFRRIVRFPAFNRSKVFFTYITHRREASTDRLVAEYFGAKKIIVPVMKANRICLRELKNPLEFVNGKFGIREPAHCLPARQLDLIDVAFVPAVAFDLCGHRIGYGGGHFDRLLSKLRCTTIGLAYEFQIIDKVPARSYDVAADYIVTEKRIIYCAKHKNNDH